jgi:hypothetical protein
VACTCGVVCSEAKHLLCLVPACTPTPTPKGLHKDNISETVTTGKLRASSDGPSGRWSGIEIQLADSAHSVRNGAVGPHVGHMPALVGPL